jgi:hypothetical protein
MSQMGSGFWRHWSANGQIFAQCAGLEEIAWRLERVIFDTGSP